MAFPPETLSAMVRTMIDLAAQHGLDPQRVEAIAQPLAEMFILNGRTHFYPLHGALERAIAALGPTDALNFLQSEDLAVLGKRVAALWFLTPLDPLYTLEELAQLTQQVKQHLLANQDSLLATGYPQTGFSRAPWLDWHLNMLYPAKLPVTVQGRPPYKQMWAEFKGDAERDENGNFIYDAYTWSKVSALGTVAQVDNALTPSQSTTSSLTLMAGFHWRGGKAYTEDGNPVIYVPYEEAALIDGLGAKDAARMEALRQPILTLKFEILDLLRDAVQSRTSEGLLSRCLDLMSKRIMADDADYLLKADGLYLRIQVRQRVYRFPFRPFYLATGGFADLLRLIDHYAAELTIGTMCKTKETLNRLSIHNLPFDYFQALGKPWKQELDAVIDQYLERERRQQEFEADFSRWVNTAVVQKLFEQTPLGGRIVQRRYAEMLRTRISWYEEYELSWLESTGTVSPPPTLSLTPVHMTRPGQEEPGNLFRRERDVWTIQYADKTIPLKHALGLAYLAQMLGHPEQEFRVEDLVAICVQPQEAQQSTVYSNLSEEELEAQNLRINSNLGDAGELLDDRARAEYKQRLQDLNKEVAEAERNHDQSQLERLEQERASLCEELEKSIGLGGRVRRGADTQEKMRKAVTNNIRNSIDKIREKHSALGQHLDDAIKTGAICTYKPPTPTSWTT